MWQALISQLVFEICALPSWCKISFLVLRYSVAIIEVDGEDCFLSSHIITFLNKQILFPKTKLCNKCFYFLYFVIILFYGVYSYHLAIAVIIVIKSYLGL